MYQAQIKYRSKVNAEKTMENLEDAVEQYSVSICQCTQVVEYQSYQVCTRRITCIFSHPALVHGMP